MSTSLAAAFERLSDSRPPTDTPVLLDRAVVMGGSVAGLMAARVLADHAVEVIIVERDDPLDRAVRRKRDLLDPHLGVLEQLIATPLQSFAPLVEPDRLVERHRAFFELIDDRFELR